MAKPITTRRVTLSFQILSDEVKEKLRLIMGNLRSDKIGGLQGQQAILKILKTEQDALLSRDVHPEPLSWTLVENAKEIQR